PRHNADVPAGVHPAVKPSILLVAALSVAALFAGCARSSDDSPAPASHSPVAAAEVAAPTVDARKTLDDLKDFSESHPYRSTGSPTMAAARDDLEARL